MNMDTFKEKCLELGISLSEKHIDLFEKYLKELLAWNEKINLTAIKTPEEIIVKHFIDSLTVLQALPKGEINLIDIGTGAGFPGIPLKIVRSEINLTLVDSIAKKVSFLEHMIQVLKLSHTAALCGRAEEYGHIPKYREHFDVVVNRAMAELPTLAEYSLPFLKMSGLWIAQKGSDSEPVEDAKTAIGTLGGMHKNTIHISISGLSPRQLILIEKVSSTPDQYPRRIGVPLKKPL